jgi:hypothetical protein
MRLVIVLAVISVVSMLSLSSCEINHRSDEFACSKNLDCASGRVCSDGFCVLAGTIDAARGDAARGDAGSDCPPGCTSCNVLQKTCTIDCSFTSCTNTVTCPSGYNCDILCNTENSCRNGVNCLQSGKCSVECSGKSSCENVTCGPGPCDVACSGPSSCRGVSCGSSCACDVVCTGNQSCQSDIQCSSVACRSGRGCTSVPVFCRSCS